MRSEIAAAFEESTRIAPDPDAVLAGIRRGIKRRKTRIITMVAIVATMLGAGAVSVSSRETSAPIAATPIIRVGEWFASVEIPYVPDGTTLREHNRTAVAETIFWSNDDQSRSLRIRIDNVDRERSLNLPGWESTTLNYRPVRAYIRSSIALFVWQLPSGRWAEMDLRLDGESQSRMQGIMLTILYEFKEKQGMPLSVNFAPTYLPTDHRIIGVGIAPPLGHGLGTITTSTGSLEPRELAEYRVGPDLVDQRRRPDLGRGLTIAVHKDYPPPLDTFKQLPDIDGRPASYYFGANHELVIRNFHGGVLVITNVSSLPAASDPLSELIKVAEGIRWLS
jgi:hypothetical protein